MTEDIILDSYALLAFLEKEPEGETVNRLLTAAEKGDKSLFLSFINLAEVYYRTIRNYGLEQAKLTISTLRKMPITIVSVTDEQVMKAAEIKGKYPIALGDCFAVALALEKKALILTADHEFKKVEKLVKIKWL